MGFLDNMVRGLISESTGYDTRQVSRWVRRIGGSKLLLAGGAVVAGALAAQHLSGKDKSPTAAPPPPPPSGGPVPPDLPPLPPLPTTGAEAGGDAAGNAGVPSGQLLFLVVRAMAAAALADGELAPEERAALEGHLEGSELTPEQIQRVRKDLVLPPTPAELAETVEDLPEAEAAEAPEVLYRAAALIIHADREVSGLETSWLDRLASELGLSGERARELRAEVFADPEAGVAVS